MSAELKITNVNTHVVDILGSVKGRDQPVMKMDKAVKLVQCLDEEVFINDDYVFFDPFCKAGEILLATALVSMLYKSKRKLVSLDSVYKELYQSNRYFALAPDERHYNLSLRTFYGNEKSHDKGFISNIENGGYLSEIDGRLNKEQFNRRLKAMLEYIKEKTGNKKIIAVGNPPYQEIDGGFGNSASAIYTDFATSLIDSPEINDFLLVIPSRWFITGKGTRTFREKVIENKYIKSIQHFENAKEIFPTVEITGGVCFLYYKQFYHGKVLFKSGNNMAEVDLSDHEIILDDPLGYSLIQKIKDTYSGDFVSKYAWSRKPFGLSTNYFEQKESLNPRSRYAIPCYKRGQQILYADIRDVAKNKNEINKYKVVSPKSYGAKRIPPKNQFFIIDKNIICTETYIVLDVFDEKKNAENFLRYLHTDFVRYFFGLRKITQDMPKDCWGYVPYLKTILESSWNIETIYKHFKITKTEREYISKQEKLWSDIKV